VCAYEKDACVCTTRTEKNNTRTTVKLQVINVQSTAASELFECFAVQQQLNAVAWKCVTVPAVSSWMSCVSTSGYSRGEDIFYFSRASSTGEYSFCTVAETILEALS
jgi:hypothetical protein